MNRRNFLSALRGAPLLPVLALAAIETKPEHVHTPAGDTERGAPVKGAAMTFSNRGRIFMRFADGTQRSVEVCAECGSVYWQLA